MAIEIVILSGARQGERLEFDKDTFFVGDSRGDEIRFDVSADPGARDRRVEFRKYEDGWKIRSVGNQPVVVNYAEVHGETPVRSGDIVRMSDAGPDFSFALTPAKKQLDSVAASATKSASELAADQEQEQRQTADKPPRVVTPLVIGGLVVAVAVLVYAASILDIWKTNRPSATVQLPSIDEQITDEGQRVSVSCAAINTGMTDDLQYGLVGDSPDGAQIDPVTGLFSWTPTEDHGPGDFRFTISAIRDTESDSVDHLSFNIHVREVNRPPIFTGSRSPAYQVELGEVVQVNLEAVDPDQPQQQLRYQLTSDSPAGVEIDENTGRIEWSPKPDQADRAHEFQVSVTDDGTVPLSSEITIQVIVEKPDLWRQVARTIIPSIHLLAAEDPKSRTSFPYGTGVAIAPQALLTSGALAVELYKRQQAGWSIYALHGEGDQRLVVENIEVHLGFASLPESPAEQIYFDIAILTVADEMPSVCPLATPHITTALAAGQRLLCVGFVHDGSPLSRVEFPVTVDFPASLLGTSSLNGNGEPVAAEAPRLMHVRLASPPRSNPFTPPIIPKNLFGSPLVTEQGELVGIYADHSELSDSDAELTNLVHYAVVPALAEAWLQNQGRDLWSEPTIEPSKSPDEAAPEADTVNESPGE